MMMNLMWMVVGIGGMMAMVMADSQKKRQISSEEPSSLTNLDRFHPPIIGVEGKIEDIEYISSNSPNVFASTTPSETSPNTLSSADFKKLEKLMKSKKAEPQLQKIIREEVTVKVRFSVKMDPIFLALCFVFFISLDMLKGLVNLSADSQVAMMAIAISSSGIMGVAVFALLSNVLHMKVKYESFKESIIPLLQDFLWLIPIIVINVISGYFIAGSRISYSTLEIGALFSIINAFAEECVFSFFLCTSFYALSKNKTQQIASVFIVAVIFAVYHVFVYDFSEIIVIFLLRILLNLVYLRSHRLSSVIILHVFNNFIAILPLILAWGL